MGNNWFELNGEVFTPTDVTFDKFKKEFEEWLESKGWGYGGMMRQMSPEELAEED